MFKYLIKKQIVLLKTGAVRNFSSNETKRSKINFFDKIKEKFSIKTEDRINYSELNNRDEAKDKLKASKLENVEDYEDDLSVRNEGMLNNLELAIEKIDINLQFETKEEEDKKILFHNTNEYLMTKFKINTKNFGEEYENVYSQRKWEEIENKCERLKKNGLDDFHIKTIINKM
jgi:hypothetical protein